MEDALGGVTGGSSLQADGKLDQASTVFPWRQLMHVLVWIGIVLLVLWGVLWLGFNIVSGLVHLLVLVAVVMIAWGLLKKGARAVDRRL